MRDLGPVLDHKGAPAPSRKSDRVQWLSQDHQRAWTFVGEASRRHCASQILRHHDAALGPTAERDVD